MHVLVINCGSSSLKASVVDTASGDHVARAVIERIGGTAMLKVDGEASECAAPDHDAALDRILAVLTGALPSGVTIAAVGHRVVHGGERFSAPTRIDAAVEATIDELASLAPLHNPANLAGIRAARRALPDVPHVAVFDTAFHASMPRRARHYALPHELATRLGLRRYGFHGTSHEWVTKRVVDYLTADPKSIRLVSCHLGNGCSIAAVENGVSVETSMGLTPLEGLVMGTRSGDLDPGLLLHLMRTEGLDVDAADELLNKRSGLAGLSGIGNDMRDIEARAAEGHEPSRLAIHVFTHRVRKYVGAYAAVMGGVDVIAFTAGIGQNSALIRHRIAQRLDFLGARLDEDKNRDAKVDANKPVAEISTALSRVRLLVVAADEERAIAESTARLAQHRDRPKQPRTIPIAVSARHIHLTDAAVVALFGEGHSLTPLKELSQPGQFACAETVTLVGPKRRIENVRILGPTRGKNQVEISRTDEFWLGLDAPVRRSGDVANTPGTTLVGPAGRLTLTNGVICAGRHIHMTPADAEAFGVEPGDVVEVAIDGGSRDLTFGDVLVRVSDAYALEMHIDTDEANAAELDSGAEGLLEHTSGEATLVRRRTTFDAENA